MGSSAKGFKVRPARKVVRPGAWWIGFRKKICNPAAAPFVGLFSLGCAFKRSLASGPSMGDSAKISRPTSLRGSFRKPPKAKAAKAAKPAKSAKAVKPAKAAKAARDKRVLAFKERAWATGAALQRM